ncbi:MAG: tyrosine-protein phosphatase [Planctomycetia bacterium]|nr:tyrosine-protein phosphatase [Planctomycetia bacterium]
MPNWVRWVLGVMVAVVAIGPPVALYRAQYIHAKRFREVEPGRVYRSGQMTESGFREMIERHGIKTVVNLQHEQPDPLLVDRWLGKSTIRESELCRELGVRYVLLTPDVLPPGNTLDKQPPVVAEWLALLDDESNYPILLHCKAGLHRTGRLTAIYRMEYHGWSQGEALRELRANGYGFVAASESDDFVVQFIQNYKPRGKHEKLTAQAAEVIARGAMKAEGVRR